MYRPTDLLFSSCCSGVVWFADLPISIHCREWQTQDILAERVRSVLLPFCREKSLSSPVRFAQTTNCFQVPKCIQRKDSVPILQGKTLDRRMSQLYRSVARLQIKNHCNRTSVRNTGQGNAPHMLSGVIQLQHF